MKVIIRLRLNSKIMSGVEESIKNFDFDIVKYIHPKDLTFADFNNNIFKKIDDDIFIFNDDDVIMNKGIYEMIDYINENINCVMVSGILIPNNKKIRTIINRCFKPNFNFGCCIVRSSFLKSIIIPSYMECNEDDYYKQVANENKYEMKVFKYIRFEHKSDNWERKLLNGLRWTVANTRLYWDKNKCIDDVCPFEYNHHNVSNFAGKLTTNKPTRRTHIINRG